MYSEEFNYICDKIEGRRLMNEKRYETHKIPYGYPVNSGYEGWVGTKFMLFPTEQEYLDWADWYNHQDEAE